MAEEQLAMPDGRMNRLQPEIYLSYMEGVNAAAQNHREMGDSALRHLVNGTVRGGWVETRPSFHCIQPIFANESDKDIFEQGKVQGSGYYSTGSGAVIVYAIDGNLFALDPLTRIVTNVNPNGEQPFSKFAHFVYFQTRAGYLVSGDGIGRQVITEGLESRYARPADPYNEVPTSLMMADDWGRLAVVDPDRRRIRLSNHELDPDPKYSPLGFHETFDYYLSSRWFRVPDHIGDITWIGFLPTLNSDTGTGPLAVLGEKGMRYYDVSIDRSQWKVQDISGTLLPGIGGLAHRAQVTRNDTLIFSDQYGRIRNLKNADRDQRTLTVKRFDRHVYPYYENEPADLQRFRMAVEWGQRILVTVQPESKYITGARGDCGDPRRFRVRHRGITVWNGEISEISDERESNVWDGLWTGIYPAALNVGRFGQASIDQLCVALSVDDDEINRPYLILNDHESRYDIAPSVGNPETLTRKRIETQIVTRQLDFSARDSDYSLLLKRLNRGVVRVGERYGKTDLQGFIQSDKDYLSRPWFEHSTNASHELGYSDCSITAGLPQHDPKLQLPSDQAPGTDPVHCTKLQNFYKAAIHFIYQGWMRLEEMAFEAVKQTQNNTTNTKCQAETAKRNVGCKPNLWRYHARNAPDYE